MENVELHFPFIVMIGRELSRNEQGCVLGCSWKLMYDKPHTLLNSNASPTQWALETANKIIESVEIFPDPGFQCHPANPRLLLFCCRWFQSEASALTSWVGEHPNISNFHAIFSSETDATLVLLELFCTRTKTCVWAWNFLCNPTIQPVSHAGKKRSSKISKDHQRSKLQIQIIADFAGISAIAPGRGRKGIAACWWRCSDYREKIVLPYHDFDKKEVFPARSEFLIPISPFWGKKWQIWW